MYSTGIGNYIEIEHQYILVNLRMLKKQHLWL